MDSSQKNPALAKQPKTLICYICGRQYGTKSLAIHLKSCKAKWEQTQSLVPKKDRRKMPTTPKGLYDLLAKTNIDDDDIRIYNKGANDKFNYEALVKCDFCNRTFFENRMENHKKICTKEKPFKPLPPNTKNIDELPLSSNKDSQFSEQNMYQEQAQDLVECPKCQRKFASDRIAKHEAVCKGAKSSNKKEPTHQGGENMVKSFVTQKKEITNLQVAREQKKQQVSDKQILENQSCVPKLNNQSKNQNLSEKKIPEVAEEATNNLIQCPYCDRKFNEQAAERHIVICENVQHKPKKNLQKPMAQTLTTKLATTQLNQSKTDGKIIKTYKKSSQDGYKFNL